jgi:GT2 family glycosyltransferase
VRQLCTVLGGLRPFRDATREGGERRAFRDAIQIFCVKFDDSSPRQSQVFEGLWIRNVSAPPSHDQEDWVRIEGSEQLTISMSHSLCSHVSLPMQRHITMTAGVIVVGHNSGRWLRACLDSLEDLADSGLFVVYVDNASTDESIEIARCAGARHVVINRENVGFAVACNQGAHLASELSADVLFFLNPDTRATRAAILACEVALMADRSLGVVGPLQTEYGRSDPPRFNAWTRRAVLCATTYPLRHSRVTPLGQKEFARWRATSVSPAPVWYVNGAAFAVRTELYHQCGGLDPGYFMFFEEVDLCRRIRALGYGIVLLSDTQVEHAWGGHDSDTRWRHWIRSKYRFLFTDSGLAASRRWQLFCEHVKADAPLVASKASERRRMAALWWFVSMLFKLGIERVVTVREMPCDEVA